MEISFIVLSENRCPRCGKKRIKDIACGGDYHETIAGYLCQEYCNGDCPMNGILKPDIEGIDPSFISNRGKRAIAVRIAQKKNLGISETKQIANDINTNNKDDFIIEFAKKIQYPLFEILKFTN